jgi:hypothetical protein
MLKFKFQIINTRTAKQAGVTVVEPVKKDRRPTRQQRRLLAASTEVAHANADYIVHHADDNGWRGISRVPVHFNLSYFRGTVGKYESSMWKYNVGECKTTYRYRYGETGTGNTATHTIILNNGDTFTCTTMHEVKQELKRRRA